MCGMRTMTVAECEERKSKQSNGTRRLTRGHANWVIMCCFTHAVWGRWRLCGGACEMSCVNEPRFGPLHLLVRLTATGWQLYELCSRLLQIQYAPTEQGWYAVKISVCSFLSIIRFLASENIFHPLCSRAFCVVLWGPAWLAALFREAPNMTVYYSQSWPQGESKFSPCSQRTGLKKHRAPWFTKDRGEGTLQPTSFTNAKLAKGSRVRVQSRGWTWE